MTLPRWVMIAGVGALVGLGIWFVIAVVVPAMRGSGRGRPDCRRPRRKRSGAGGLGGVMNADEGDEQDPSCACPENMERDDDGECVCKDGFEKFGKVCVPECAEGSTRRPDGVCECVCPDGFLNVGGRCLERCGDVACETGTRCRDNKCLPECNGGMPCAPNEFCVRGAGCVRYWKRASIRFNSIGGMPDRSGGCVRRAGDNPVTELTAYWHRGDERKWACDDTQMANWTMTVESTSGPDPIVRLRNGNMCIAALPGDGHPRVDAAACTANTGLFAVTNIQYPSGGGATDFLRPGTRFELRPVGPNFTGIPFGYNQGDGPQGSIVWSTNATNALEVYRLQVQEW